MSALGILGKNIGSWIYVIDAVDDLEDVQRKENWNPFLNLSKEEAKSMANKYLENLEKESDQIACLLPYQKYGGIASNLFLDGMPRTRALIFAGKALPKL